jgi:hypothetical protein
MPIVNFTPEARYGTGNGSDGTNGYMRRESIDLSVPSVLSVHPAPLPTRLNLLKKNLIDTPQKSVINCCDLRANFETT